MEFGKSGRDIGWFDTLLEGNDGTYRRSFESCGLGSFM